MVGLSLMNALLHGIFYAFAPIAIVHFQYYYKLSIWTAAINIVVIIELVINKRNDLDTRQY